MYKDCPHLGEHHYYIFPDGVRRRRFRCKVLNDRCTEDWQTREPVCENAVKKEKMTQRRTRVVDKICSVEDCNNQVWLACTAQQSLEEVSDNVDNSGNVNEAFGKILGRFETRISLQSNDAAYITQRRVLDKNSKGMESWQQGGLTYYKISGPAIKDMMVNQFVFCQSGVPLIAQVKELNGRTALLQTLRDYSHSKNAIWGIR